VVECQGCSLRLGRTRNLSNSKSETPKYRLSYWIWSDLIKLKGLTRKTFTVTTTIAVWNWWSGSQELEFNCQERVHIACKAPDPTWLAGKPGIAIRPLSDKVWGSFAFFFSFSMQAAASSLSPKLYSGPFLRLRHSTFFPSTLFPPTSSHTPRFLLDSSH